jgi:hypothetical protein
VTQITNPPGLVANAALQEQMQSRSARALADDGSEQARVARRTELTDDLEAAAIRLRDAELEQRAAGKAYREALEAFNRFVAPVSE